MKRIATTLLALSIANTATASGIPTVDIVGNLQELLANALRESEHLEAIAQGAQQIQNQLQNIQELKNSVQNELTQIAQLDDQILAMTGFNEYSQLFNGDLERELRRTLPSNLDEFVAIYDNDDSSNEAAAETQKARETEAFKPEDIYSADNTSIAAQNYKQSAESIYSTIGVSQLAYKKSNEKLDQLENMMDELDNTDDMKAAIDLNNRIGMENAMLMNELIKQITLLNIQQGKAREQAHLRSGADKKMASASAADMSFSPNSN